MVVPDSNRNKNSFACVETKTSIRTMRPVYRESQTVNKRIWIICFVMFCLSLKASGVRNKGVNFNGFPMDKVQQVHSGAYISIIICFDGLI